MGFQFRLLHKGIALVAVMLLFEMTFLLVLTELLQQAERDLFREAHAKAILAAATTLNKDIWQLGLTLLVSRDEGRLLSTYDSMREQIADDLRGLGALAANDPDRTTAFASVQSLSDRILRGIDEQRQAVTGEKTGLEKAQQLEPLLLDVIRQLDRFTLTQRELVASLPRQKDSRQNIATCIIVGCIVHIVIAFWWCVWLFRSITSRLDILVQNTFKLAANQTLHPVMQGQDEIAQVDKEFHAMARALDAATRKEKAILSNSVDVICAIDENETISFVSPSVMSEMGYNPDLLVGTPVTRLLPPNETHVLTNRLKDVRVRGQSERFETKLLSARSSEELECVWSSCWSEELKSWFCIIHDVTQQRRLERLKQEFVAMVSHDLRTPLTSVTGILSMAVDGIYGEVPTPLAQSLSQAERITTRLMDMVSNILDADKLDSGTFHLDCGSYDLAQIVGKACESVTPFATTSGVSLRTELAECGVKCDSDRLEQVLINLLSNAIKFSPAGGTVYISSQRRDEYVELSIIDEGPGIEECMQDQIFEKFRQVDGVAQVHRNSGLGLYICKQLIELMGGSIGVESTLGKGSRFWLTISAT